MQAFWFSIHLFDIYKVAFTGEYRNFRICLCLEIGSKPQEAMPYCQKALSLCKSRVDRLTSEVKNSSGLSENAAESERDQTVQQSSSTTNSLVSAAEKEAEIETLTGLSVELEKKASLTYS